MIKLQTMLPTLSPAEAEETFHYLGTPMTVHADAQSTNGQFALLEFFGMPGMEPPLHVHQREDELFYVLGGQITAFCGGEEIVLREGMSGFLPRGVPHTFRIDTPLARALVLISPGGFEGYFREISEKAPHARANTLSQSERELLAAVGARYGAHFVKQ